MKRDCSLGHRMIEEELHSGQFAVSSNWVGNCRVQFSEGRFYEDVSKLLIAFLLCYILYFLNFFGDFVHTLCLLNLLKQNTV